MTTQLPPTNKAIVIVVLSDYLDMPFSSMRP